MNSLLLALVVFASSQAAPQPPLIVAVRKGDVKKVASLLKAGADPNTRELLVDKPSATDKVAGGKVKPGSTALTAAVERNSLPLVKLLLQYKADPNAREPYGWTPLMSACQRGDLEIVKLLLAKGAKPNTRNQNGDTAIIFAANIDYVTVVDALLTAGANVNGGTGITALGIAAQCGSVKTVKLLLKKGADPNFSRKGWPPPLELAYQSYSDEIVAMIKKAGGKGRSKAEVDRENEKSSKEYQKEWEKQRAQKAKLNAEYAKLKPDDKAVIAAVLVDMLTAKGSEFEIFQVKSIVLVSVNGESNEYTESQMNAELEDSQANQIDVAMRRDLLRRNANGISLAGFKFDDPRIQVKDAKDFDGSLMGEVDRRRNGSPMQGWVQTLLPGYSEDGTRAVVRFHYGPSPHGAAGTYLLKAEAGVWKVVWRDFAHYV